MTRVGFVGVGSMGRPMLERVLAAGFEVSFFARRPEVVEQVGGLGAQSTSSLGELAAASDVVVVVVYTDAQLREVCLGDDGLIGALSQGSMVVVHTTCSPTTLAELVEHGRARDVGVVDAAFSGGPDDAAERRLTVLAGAPEDLLERARPVLSAYADPILPVGGPGDGQRVKLVNNALFGACVSLVVQAESVAEGLGLDPAKAFDAIAHCSGDSFALETARSVGSARQLLELAGRYIEKDVATVRELAAEAGVDLGPLTIGGEIGAGRRGRSHTPTVQELWDIEQIKQLKARYFRLLDTKDWDAFRELFTDDCQHVLPAEADTTEAQGNEAYFASTMAALADSVTTHHGHMPEITLLGPTEAEGIWAMFDYVDIPGTLRIKGYGHYVETYRKGTDGQWRISSKRNERLRLDRLPQSPPTAD